MKIIYNLKMKRNLESKASTIWDLLNNPQNVNEFHIPIYQREYSWEKKNIERLFEDLQKIHNKKTQESHFLGTITLNKINLNNNNFYLEVIDGQQRLTTFFLILIIIFHYHKSQTNQGTRGFKDKYELKDILNATLKTRNHTDKVVWEKISQSSSFRELEDIFTVSKTFYTGNLKDNFLEISKFIKDGGYYSWIAKLDLLEICELLSKIDIVVVTFDNLRKPEVIFETLNSLNKPLEAWDLAKNFFFANCVDAQNTSQCQDEVDIFWNLKINRNYKFIQDAVTKKAKTTKENTTKAKTEEAKKIVKRKEHLLQIFVYTFYNKYASRAAEVAENNIYERLISLYDMFKHSYFTNDLPKFNKLFIEYCDDYQAMLDNRFSNQGIEEIANITFYTRLLLGIRVWNDQERTVLDILLLSLYRLQKSQKVAPQKFLKIVRFLCNWILRVSIYNDSSGWVKGANKSFTALSLIINKAEDTDQLSTNLHRFIHSDKAQFYFPNDIELLHGENYFANKSEESVLKRFVNRPEEISTKGFLFHNFARVKKAKAKKAKVKKGESVVVPFLKLLLASMANYLENKIIYDPEDLAKYQIDLVLPLNWRKNYNYLYPENTSNNAQLSTSQMRLNLQFERLIYSIGNFVLLKKEILQKDDGFLDWHIEQKQEKLWSPYANYKIMQRFFNEKTWNFNSIILNAKAYFDTFIKLFPYENIFMKERTTKTNKKKPRYDVDKNNLFASLISSLISKEEKALSKDFSSNNKDVQGFWETGEYYDKFFWKVTNKYTYRKKDFQVLAITYQKINQDVKSAYIHFNKIDKATMDSFLHNLSSSDYDEVLGFLKFEDHQALFDSQALNGRAIRNPYNGLSKDYRQTIKIKITNQDQYGNNISRAVEYRYEVTKLLKRILQHTLDQLH